VAVSCQIDGACQRGLQQLVFPVLAANAHHPAALTWFENHRVTWRRGVQAQFIGCSMTDTPTLDALPLFPLELVLFPGGFMPLRIFEVRYLDMVNQCEKTGAPFGVVTLARGSEVRTAAIDLAGGAQASQTVFHPVGTLARITQLSRPQPGLIMINCVGAQRFEVSQPELLKHGLWVGQAKLLPDDQSVPIPEDLLPVASALARVLDTLKAQGVMPEQMPIQPPYALHDCAWVANRWCDLLPMALAQKHRLMTLDNPLLRLELVSDLLERHGIAT